MGCMYKQPSTYVHVHTYVNAEKCLWDLINRLVARLLQHDKYNIDGCDLPNMYICTQSCAYGLWLYAYSSGYLANYMRN